MFKLLILILLTTVPPSSVIVPLPIDFAACPTTEITTKITADLQAYLDETRGSGKAIVADIKCVSSWELHAPADPA